MKYASAREGAFTDTPIYDHVAWLLEQKYLWDNSSDRLTDTYEPTSYNSYSTAYASYEPVYAPASAPVETYEARYDTYQEFSGGGRHRAYAA